MCEVEVGVSLITPTTPNVITVETSLLSRNIYGEMSLICCDLFSKNVVD